mgnify:CR=1 FL=1
MTDSTSFQEELFQEVKNKADSEGVYKNDAFFDLITDYLCDAENSMRPSPPSVRELE